jgi:hypothetical protein
VRITSLPSCVQAPTPNQQLMLSNPVLNPNNPAAGKGIGAAADAMANKTKDTFFKVRCRACVQRELHAYAKSALFS